MQGRYGHHGLSVAHTADSLFQNLHFSSEWRHALTVDHRSNGNVFKNISSDGLELSLDHHRDSPFENLFTKISSAVNLFNGGSSCAGYPGGARNTVWGHTTPLVPPYWKHIQTNLVGPSTVAQSLTTDREWIEVIEDVFPADLHKAQLHRRMGWPFEDTAAPSDTGHSSDSRFSNDTGSGDDTGTAEDKEHPGLVRLHKRQPNTKGPDPSVRFSWPLEPETIFGPPLFERLFEKRLKAGFHHRFRADASAFCRQITGSTMIILHSHGVGRGVLRKTQQIEKPSSPP